jgi:hypothetical protein
MNLPEGSLSNIVTLGYIISIGYQITIGWRLKQERGPEKPPAPGDEPELCDLLQGIIRRFVDGREDCRCEHHAAERDRNFRDD